MYFTRHEKGELICVGSAKSAQHTRLELPKCSGHLCISNRLSHKENNAMYSAQVAMARSAMSPIVSCNTVSCTALMMLEEN